ncbi:MAG: hypothetical protein PVI30_09620 [Myxococcales bacterium]
MNPQVLIDALVRQTTVLIARIATLQGVRSPLGHVANEVFVGLVDELGNQGVSNKVIADMFGMALRSYRQKVQRLGESATTRGVTLWTAVQRFLAEDGPATRAELFARFVHDDEVSVRGILSDLVESGLIVRSGRGDATHYRVATAEEIRDAGSRVDEHTEDADSALVWVHIYREGPIDIGRLAQLVALPAETLEAAVEALQADGRIQRELRNGTEVFTARQVLIPVGETAGWEASVVDHHRAVLTAIGAKLTGTARASTAADEIGGTTLTFDLWPGHPREEQVRALLRDTRERVLPLWEEVEEYNRDHPHGETYQVHYYCGQNVVEEEEP